MTLTGMKARKDAYRGAATHHPADSETHQKGKKSKR